MWSRKCIDWVALGALTISLFPFRIAHAIGSTTIMAPVGETAGDQFGSGVGGHVDMNGDGFADIIVGAWRNAAGGFQAGRAYVYLGGAAPKNTPDLTMTGEAVGDIFGRAVAGAGDVNGDGFGDMVVGAPYSDGNGYDAGRVYVYFGGSTPDAKPDFILTGRSAGDHFGISLKAVGDMNRDGFGDFIVGAHFNDTGGAQAGQAYVYFGGSAPDTNAVLVLTGLAAGDQLGFSVASAGDVNGDGFDDVIVGAPGSDAGGPDAGQAYVFFGGADADTVPDLVLTGETAGDRFGVAVGSAGDFNGDGFADLLVGADANGAGGPLAGRVYLFLGGPQADTTADLVLTGEASGDFFGAQVDGGDINGDGFSDAIVSAWGNDGAFSQAGRVYVFFGGPTADAVADILINGDEAGSTFGISMATAGDVNGDGILDIIAGARHHDAGGEDAGRAYVWGAEIKKGELKGPR